MNIALLSESLTSALKDLDPEQRQRIIDDTIRHYIARDAESQKRARIIAMLRARKTYRQIQSALGVSHRTICLIKCEMLSHMKAEPL